MPSIRIVTVYSTVSGLRRTRRVPSNRLAGAARRRSALAAGGQSAGRLVYRNVAIVHRQPGRRCLLRR
jgi:hypothetical protein